MKTIARSESKYAGNAAAVLALVSDVRVYPEETELENRFAESSETDDFRGVEGLSVVPNPNDGRFEIFLNSKPIVSGMIFIYSSAGQKVYENRVENINSVVVDIPIRGLYLAVFKNSDGKLYTDKFIVE